MPAENGDLPLSLRGWGRASSCLHPESGLVAETMTGLSWQAAGAAGEDKTVEGKDQSRWNPRDPGPDTVGFSTFYAP